MIKSEKFNDVYFSADGGMDETRHVFLDGNHLPQAWEDRDEFTIAETGFGTGLNFLCAWKLFEGMAKPHQKLHFISVEKYPLSKEEIHTALSGWEDELGDYLDHFLNLYPIRVPGPHHIYISDRVTLTIWFDDVADVLPEWQGKQVDAWFLDGFTPAKNPDMWNDDLYAHMARLSHNKTTYATFTAAGDVRRGLESAGFGVEKCKGFGRKRDMIKGRFLGDVERRESTLPKKIAIIGGGLAGCAMAYVAHAKGIKATIYEVDDSLASGASGGKLGMINPKLTAKPTAHSDYYTSAYAHALRVLSQIDDIDFNVSGSLHLCVDDDKDRRFTGYIDNLGWHNNHIQREGDDLFYPDGANVSPEKLCHKLADHADVCLNYQVDDLNTIDADIIVIANGYDANTLLNDDDLPIGSVRGQVSWVKPQSDINYNICFGGYITPQTSEGFHILGSSFQPWEIDTDLKDEDHESNIERYNNAMNKDLSMDDVVGGWAALRTSSKDRFPIVGQIDDKTYISTAHGSHGIISSLMGASILMQLMSGQMSLASQGVLSALSPKRFHKR
jgi:tRNA 5-methylaminomethyl-2-thiouridine biosynthesis bifunctional protein